MSAPRLLCVDTATASAVVGLCQGDALVVEETLTTARDHAERLLPTLDALLARAGWQRGDLDALVVGVGPGSFVGVRIGVATLKGLALGLGRPLVGVSTTEVLALSTDAAGRVAVAIDAKKGQVYAAVHDVDAAPGVVATPLPPQALDPDPCAARLLALAPLAARVGDGFARFDATFAALARVPLIAASPRARALALLALPRLRAGDVDDLADLQPFYARRSEAEENAARRGAAAVMAAPASTEKSLRGA